MVSIPSGRGFWAGFQTHRRSKWVYLRLNPLWSGLLGRLNFQHCAHVVEFVSIPSGRGFWAGKISALNATGQRSRLNPLWSGLLGRHQIFS